MLKIKLLPPFLVFVCLAQIAEIDFALAMMRPGDRIRHNSICGNELEGISNVSLDGQPLFAVRSAVKFQGRELTQDEAKTVNSRILELKTVTKKNMTPETYVEFGVLFSFVQADVSDEFKSLENLLDLTTMRYFKFKGQFISTEQAQMILTDIHFQMGSASRKSPIGSLEMYRERIEYVDGLFNSENLRIALNITNEYLQWPGLPIRDLEKIPAFINLLAKSTKLAETSISYKNSFEKATLFKIIFYYSRKNHLSASQFIGQLGKLQTAVAIPLEARSLNDLLQNLYLEKDVSLLSTKAHHYLDFQKLSDIGKKL